MPDRRSTEEQSSEPERADARPGRSVAATPATDLAVPNSVMTALLEGGAAAGPVPFGPGVSNRELAGLMSGAAEIVPPGPGPSGTGFIDHSDGSNLRTGPAERGGQVVRPLPPATRVFLSGAYPGAADWHYVTAYLDDSMVRGYVQGFRVTTDLPEPTARLHNVVNGDTAEKLAAREFGDAVEDGHDLRFYENVLLYVNKGRAGITGSYQDPGLLGGGANNIQLTAGHRIWLVSPAYAKALKGVVPSGSLTGGAVAKARRFAVHLEDIVDSVTESPRHLGAVAGEYAQAIRDHLPEIIGIVAGFVMAEMASAFLAATPTGVGQVAAVLIQLGLAAFGAVGMVEAGVEAIKHADAWLTQAWTASGDPAKVSAASREFLRMLVCVAMAALSYIGVKGNMGNAVKIAGSMAPPMAPAFAVAGGGQVRAGAGSAVALGPPQPFGPVGSAVAMTSQSEGGGGGGYPENWKDFDPANHGEFEEALKKFRNSEDLTTDPKLRGGEGQLFPHADQPRALKRWYLKQLGKFKQSVEKLEEAAKLIEGDPALSRDMTVVDISQKGTDWIERGFDPTSVPLKNALGDEAVAAARQRCVDALKAEQGSAAKDILKKLTKNSANLHWSPEQGKILIIDMQ
jgi:hypothetical protein